FARDSLVNQIKKLAEDIEERPRVKRSPDPGDNFLLALAEAGNADYLVTGDKSGLLLLASHKSTRIMTARVCASATQPDRSTTTARSGRFGGHVLLRLKTRNLR